LAEARDTTGGIVQKRYFGQGFQAVTGSNSGSYCYLRDQIGSIRAITDGTGSIRAGYDYDPYGTSTRLLGSVGSDELFTGFYNHAPSNLDLAVFRAYNPAVGRWISRDPIGERGGSNLYEYVLNDPVNLVDFKGDHPTCKAPPGDIGHKITDVMSHVISDNDWNNRINQNMVIWEDVGPPPNEATNLGPSTNTTSLPAGGNTTSTTSGGNTTSPAAPPGPAK
jgi:RHS repeat-associated protein